MFVAYRVPPKTSEGRADKVLNTLFPQRSRSAWKAVLHGGAVRCGNKALTASSVLSSGMELELEESLLWTKSDRLSSVIPVQLKALYADGMLLAINKPRMLPSHPLHWNDPPTAWDSFAALAPGFIEAGDKELEGGLLHRLDNGTSGVLLAASNRLCFESYAPLIRGGQSEKSYLALVEGDMHHLFTKADVYTLDTVLGHDPKDERRMLATEGTQEARSRLELIAHSGLVSLVRVRLSHAHRHQVRVHLASLGHPLLGDSLYGARRLAQQGFALHAQQLEFAAASDQSQSLQGLLSLPGKSLQISCEPGEDFWTFAAAYAEPRVAEALLKSYQTR